MLITRSDFINILKQQNLLDFAGKGVTDENFDAVIRLGKLLQKYDLCADESYAETVAFEFFEKGLDVAFSSLQFAEEKEETTASATNKLNIILNDRTLDLKDWSKEVNLIKNVGSILDQLRSKSDAELDVFIGLFMQGKPVSLQGGSIQGTKLYNSRAPERSKIGNGWTPFEIKPNPGRGNSAEYRIYGIYKNYTMVLIYKSIKNGGQGREDLAYDRFGELANMYIKSLNESVHNWNSDFMKKSDRFTYTSVEDLMNDQLTLFEELELATLRQDLDLYLEGVDDGYAGVDKKDYINEEYSRGYEVGKNAKEKEERFNEFKAKLAAYKAANQK